MDDLLSRPAPRVEDVPNLDLRPTEMLKRGWELVRPHYVNLLLILLAWTVVSGLLGRSRLGGPISLVLHAVMQSGLFYYLLRAYRGEAPSFADLLVPIQRKPAEILVVTILLTVTLILATLLLILPGIYASVVLALAVPLVVVTTVSPFESLRLSRAIVHRQLGDWFVLLLCIFLLNLVAMIPFGLGLLVSLPVSMGALTIAFASVLGLPAAPVIVLPAETGR